MPEASISHTAPRSRYFLNSRRDRKTPPDLFSDAELSAVVEFFRTYPGYAPTPLHLLNAYAAELGIAEIMVKDESSRLGLNAFKISGVVYAVHQSKLRGEIRDGSALACATAGNHGRAVAHAARVMNLRAHVYMHKGSSPARIQAIASEGAQVTIVDGTYDDAVTRVVEDANKNGWCVVSDTSWEGYEAIPHDIMAGYTMLLAEAAEQWSAIPDAVFVQAGVGGLAGAIVGGLQKMFGASSPKIVCCEPTNAACVLESLRAGKSETFPGSLETMMAGLSAGTVSAIAWPVLSAGLDAAVAITDNECRSAIYRMAHPAGGDPQIIAGESGASGIATLAAVTREADLRPVRDFLALTPDSRVFVINTEGATDPDNFEAITGLRIGASKSQQS
jgi:diaminopropionate ammonia-lyase